MTALVQVLLLLSTLALVYYASTTAWMDYQHTPCEVLHKYEGRPRGEGGFYFAEFATRKEAKAYARKLRNTPGCSHVQVIVTDPDPLAGTFTEA